MKLLNCQLCNDIRAVGFEWVLCRCGRSGAQYWSDGLHLNFFGDARILGLKNTEYQKAVPNEDYTWFVIPETSDRIIRISPGKFHDSMRAVIRDYRPENLEVLPDKNWIVEKENTQKTQLHWSICGCSLQGKYHKCNW